MAKNFPCRFGILYVARKILSAICTNIILLGSDFLRFLSVVAFLGHFHFCENHEQLVVPSGISAQLSGNLRGCASWFPPLSAYTCCPSGPHTLLCLLVKVAHHKWIAWGNWTWICSNSKARSSEFFCRCVLFPTCDLALLGTLNEMDFTPHSFDLSHLLCCSFPFISVRHLIERPEVAKSESFPICLYGPNNVFMPQGRNYLFCRFLSLPLLGWFDIWRVVPDFLVPSIPQYYRRPDFPWSEYLTNGS